MTQPNPQRQSTAARQSRESLNLAKEIRSIQHRAAERDGRMVSIGPLVFFSTESGDAWILEPAGQLATRLAMDGDSLPALIEETDTDYAIGWQGRYRIEGAAFIYEDHLTGRVTAIRGYPVKLLQRVINNANRS
jgi:hypothetical protein